MQHFSVGRPAIREALFALHRMGLVIVANGERPRVSRARPRRPSSASFPGAARLLLAKPEGIHNFQQARFLFQSALTEEAARLASDEDIAELKNALAANVAAIGARSAVRQDRRGVPSGDRNGYHAIQSTSPCTKRSWNGRSISVVSRCVAPGPMAWPTSRTGVYSRR